jgi:hypothetical protein
MIVSTAEIHKGDIGTVIQLTLYEGSAIVDLSTATSKKLHFRKPSGVVLTKDAIFVTNGTDGKVKYTTVSGDLDTVGTWKVQAVLDFPSGHWSSSVGSFKVHANLSTT